MRKESNMKYYISETGEIKRASRGKLNTFLLKNSFSSKRDAKNIRDLLKKLNQLENKGKT